MRISSRYVRLVILVFISLSIGGCGTQSKFYTLTSRDVTYTVPQGQKITVIDPNNQTHTIEIAADEPLVCMYRGSLLELEKDANRRVIGVPANNKKNALWAGIGASILAIIAGIIKKVKGGK